MRAGPSGVHMFDRTSGLNILIDETQVNPESWSLAPSFVSVALTNACELSCPYCYAPKKPAALAFEELSEWLLELDAHGCLAVGFGGGEPTLYRRFADICRFTARETQLAVSFTTHGHNFDQRLVNILEGSIHFMRVSMDGTGSTYEGLRGRSFEALLRQIRLLSSLAPFGINFVVNRHTLPDLDQASSIAADLGASEFLVLPEQPVNGRLGIDLRTATRLRHWINEYHGTVPLAISDAWSSDIDVADPLVEESGFRQFAHIDAWGTLKRSSYDSHGFSIGAAGVIEALQLFQGVEI